MIAAILHLQKGAGLAVETIHHLARGLPHAHDVVDADFLRDAHAEIGIGLCLELFLIAKHRVHFRHRGKGLRFGLGGAAGDQDAHVWLLALQPADRLARLAHRFAR